MALNKIGLQYYNVDTDRYQDIRIKKLKKAFGTNGIAIYDYVLCEVYRVRGCFLVWDESTVFDVADYFNAKESLINEVIDYCAIVGLFDKALLDSERIITSQSIQKRYLDACGRAKRKNVKIPEKIKITPEESRKIPEQSAKTPEESDKVKYSKVKESKVESKAGEPPHSEEKFFKRQNEFMQSLVPHVATYGKEMIRRFFDYWREPNKSKTKMRWEQERTWDLELRLRKWEDNQRQFSKNGYKPEKAENTGQPLRNITHDRV